MGLSASYRARWIVPVDRPPIEGGVVTVHNGRIVSVGQTPAGEPVHDLGDVVLLPGLVNAHTHLEFSSLGQPLGQPGMGFADWIKEVITWRRNLPPGRVLGSDKLESYQRAAIRRGLAESAASSVAAIGDIVTSDIAGEEFAAQADLDCTAFIELIALRVKHAASSLVKGSLRADALPPSVRAGLSPHAPYTVNPLLLTGACQESAAKQWPLAMHLAESPDELELLHAKRGPLVDLLQSLDAWEPEALPAPLRPLDYLQALATAHRALVIHGNYLTADEIAFLAEHREHMSVIYCPRTHAFFGHQPYPLVQMLTAGVRVAVGTDSRASNPDLNLFAELQHIAQHHPTVSSEQILRLGTLSAAEALGIDHDNGSITPGKLARLAVVPLTQSPASPWEGLLTSGGSVHPLARFLERTHIAPPR
jgi:cytosine/adenosine deaminase-related metal-dependent hydrolase